MEYICSVCQRKIAGDVLMYLDHTDRHIIDLVKHDHPDWIEKDGLCKQCEEYYRHEIEGGVFGDAACALRRKKISQIFGAVKKFFNRSK